MAQEKMASLAQSESLYEQDREYADSYLKQPAEFIDTWPNQSDFPIAFSLTDVERLVKSLNGCPTATSILFGPVVVRRIRNLHEARHGLQMWRLKTCVRTTTRHMRSAYDQPGRACVIIHVAAVGPRTKQLGHGRTHTRGHGDMDMDCIETLP
jgi:hypothetical protein